MFRTALGSGFAIILLGLSGCTMCCHPYDCCGPVYDHGCYPCSAHARAGSILEGASDPAPDQLVDNSQHKAQIVQANSQHKAQYVQASTQHKPRNLQANSHRKTQNVQASTQRKTQDTQANAARTPRLGLVPGSEKIISVTDRTVTPSPGAGDQGDSSATVADSTTESPKPLPASGWTARRPTSEVQR